MDECTRRKLNNQTESLAQATLRTWTDHMLLMVKVGNSQSAAAAAERAHKAALVVDPTLRPSLLACPNCKDTNWIERRTVYALIPCTLEPVGKDGEFASFARKANDISHEDEETDGWECQGCGQGIGTAERIVTCPKDGASVFLGFCCPTCNVHFSETCTSCGQAGYHKETCIDFLVDEYDGWLRAEGLVLGSADEHLHDESLTQAQRDWLADFCERWDAASPKVSA